MKGLNTAFCPFLVWGSKKTHTPNIGASDSWDGGGVPGLFLVLVFSYGSLDSKDILNS